MSESNASATMPQSAALPPSSPPRPRAQAPVPDRTADRKSAYDRLWQNATNEPNPICTSLQIGGSDLLQTAAFLYAQVIKFGERAESVSDLQKLQPSLAMLVKVNAQAERLFRLNHEITAK